MANNTTTDTLHSIINEKVGPNRIVYSNSYVSYSKLKESRFKYERINHSKNFTKMKNHINGIENFLNQAKRHLHKFNSVPKEHFHLYIRECEWRFNNKGVANQIQIIYNLAKKDLF
ncbi:MAG: transposase [Treponemataceae bacterium]